MGIINSMVQMSLKRNARRIADWAKETYPVTKAQNNHLPEHQIHQKMLGRDFSHLNPDSRHLLDECSQTIEGICYFMADISGITKDQMTFRCLQLTTYIDAELYARGFPMQSKAMKERILKAMNYPIDGWEQWAGRA